MSNGEAIYSAEVPRREGHYHPRKKRVPAETGTQKYLEGGIQARGLLQTVLSNVFN